MQPSKKPIKSRHRSKADDSPPLAADAYLRLAEDLGRLVGRYLAEQALRERAMQHHPPSQKPS